MVGSQTSSRNPKRGIVLIATLISLMMVVSLTMVAHSSSIANTLVVKRLIAEHQVSQDQSALRELLRPVLGEAMLQTDQGVGVPLNGTPFELEYKGRRYVITAQGVDGLVNPFQSPAPLAKSLLPPEWSLLANRMRMSPEQDLPLPLLAARADASSEQLRRIEHWLTIEKDGRYLNKLTLPKVYQSVNTRTFRRALRELQTKVVLLSVTAS